MTTTPMQTAGGRLIQPITGDDHIQGPAQAPVTLVEYGDFQCPFCGAAHPVLQELMRERGERVRLVFRHFPLTNVHPYAEVAAETAEAAAARGRFWVMHDWLFEHQDRLDPLHLRSAADEIGLDGDAVDQEVRDHLHLDRIQRDFVGGVRSGVNGTPTFYINGTRHEGGYSLPELIAAVDQAS